ncbi:dihydropteroate synthase [Tropheryma whipplei]|nr:dihydropteroate synthase [Tropheryma whipplei]MCO8190600.1 dihydropteroate synthase [Tropheryma whipplei]
MSYTPDPFPPPNVMGILNITDDSFSDGGLFLDPSAAITQGRKLFAEGASIIDVGGESTRPGAERISVEEEKKRVLPVVRELLSEGIHVSLDTMNADTAKEGLSMGVAIINDVSAGKADPDMLRVIADAGCKYIAMHWRGHSMFMDSLAHYDDVVSDVLRELKFDIERITAAGVKSDQIILDPGFGFSKTSDHNWQLFRNLDCFVKLGFPVLIGLSRKRFLSRVFKGHDFSPKDSKNVGGLDNREILARDLPSGILSAIAITRGAWGVRVHDVASAHTALRTLQLAQYGSVYQAHKRAANTGIDTAIPGQGNTDDTTASSNHTNNSETGASLKSGVSQVRNMIAPPVIKIRSLRVYAYHGVYRSERDYGQQFIIDADIQLKHFPEDKIDSTLDYDSLTGKFVQYATASSVNLIETLADHLAKIAVLDPMVEWVSLSITKPNPPLAYMKQSNTAACHAMHKPDTRGDYAKEHTNLTGLQLSCTVRKVRSESVTRVYIGIGANVGNCLDNVQRAIKDIADHPMIELVSLGRLFRTTAVVGESLDESLPVFLNTAIAIDTALSMQDLLALMLCIEKKLGRTRHSRTRHSLSSAQDAHQADSTSDNPNQLHYPCAGRQGIQQPLHSSTLAHTQDGFVNRHIDLDILLAEGVQITEHGLCIPHPRLSKRAFALLPLESIDPDLHIPGHGPITDLIHGLPEDQISSVATLRDSGYELFRHSITRLNNCSAHNKAYVTPSAGQNYDSEQDFDAGLSHTESRGKTEPHGKYE